jgi:hypothetical protein
MATELPVANGVQVKLVWTLGGNPHALNILNFINAQGGTITQSVADQTDTQVKAAFTTSGISASLVTGFALDHIEMRSLTAVTDPWYTGTNPAVPGASAGNPLPAATSLVVTLKTGQRGRSFNGRVYLCGWSEDANDAVGGATAAARTQALAFIDGIRVNLVTAVPNLTLSIISRVTTPPGADVPILRNPPINTSVTAIVMSDLRWDVQRRRAVPGI